MIPLSAYVAAYALVCGAPMLTWAVSNLRANRDIDD